VLAHHPRARVLSPFAGWPSLYTLLLDAGVYRDECAQHEMVCSEQKERLTLIYTGQIENNRVNTAATARMLISRLIARSLQSPRR
jgi:hypothetical protein